MMNTVSDSARFWLTSGNLISPDGNSTQEGSGGKNEYISRFVLFIIYLEASFVYNATSMYVEYRPASVSLNRSGLTDLVSQ